MCVRWSVLRAEMAEEAWTRYTPAVAVHGVVAVLGIGQVGAVAVAVLSVRPSGVVLPQIAAWLRP